jgi:hypothetical protein
MGDLKLRVVLGLHIDFNSKAPPLSSVGEQYYIGRLDLAGLAAAFIKRACMLKIAIDKFACNKDKPWLRRG